jgi:cytoskeletal protein CcmA (bactofilin family)
MKKYAGNNSESQVPNIISTGTKVTGEIASDGDVRIDGMLTGKIHAKGKVVIGKDGVVDGEIHCLNAVISGKVNAALEVKELAVFKTTARFTGKITTAKISIETGALFSGECKMAGLEPVKQKNEGKKGE